MKHYKCSRSSIRVEYPVHLKGGPAIWVIKPDHLWVEEGSILCSELWKGFQLFVPTDKTRSIDRVWLPPLLAGEGSLTLKEEKEVAAYLVDTYYRTAYSTFNDAMGFSKYVKVKEHYREGKSIFHEGAIVMEHTRTVLTKKGREYYKKTR